MKDIARRAREAVLAIEDDQFYEHGALDLKGTLRALVQNQAGDGTQGGSTLTQQLVKMTRLYQADSAEEERATEQTYARKLRYAIGSEERFGKDWILQRSLNTAYFGGGAYGIEAAAERWFPTCADDLRLREAALLAGLVENPVEYDPTRYPERAKERRNLVLHRMGEVGAISPARAREEQDRGLGLQPTLINNGCVNSPAPFFCRYTIRYLTDNDLLGDSEQEGADVLETAGLTIDSTLDRRAQRWSNQAPARSALWHSHARWALTRTPARPT